MPSIGCTDDFSFIQDVQRGNAAAFEHLVYAQDQSVLRLALRITESRSAAQDIYQEIFLRAFKKLGNFRCECSFSTWIYRIAVNVCLDHLRREHNREETNPINANEDGEEYDLLSQLPDDKTFSNPEQHVLLRDLSAHMSRALIRLAPRERIVLELKHYQGLTLRNLSEILNCSEATVKTTLFRGMQKLRLHLSELYLGNNSSRRRPVMSGL